MSLLSNTLISVKGKGIKLRGMVGEKELQSVIIRYINFLRFFVSIVSFVVTKGRLAQLDRALVSGPYPMSVKGVHK